jgi:hypothetical protein
MLLKAFNRELAKVFNCDIGLPEDPGKYNWICPNCFEFLYLIKNTRNSEIKYYFLHKMDVKTFNDNLKNKSHVVCISNKQNITNNSTIQNETKTEKKMKKAELEALQRKKKPNSR